jgi:DNA-binding beta-propeller fold protein YncE
VYLRDETIYVAHETGNEVTGIDTDTGAIEFSVGGILQPTEVLPDRHERLLYVSARGEGKVKVIDLETRAIVGEVAVGVQPETMLLTRDRRTLIVSLRGTPARLAFVDTKSRTLTGTIDLAGSGTFGDLAAMTKDGRLVYATFDRGATGIGGVAVLDVRRHAVIDTWIYPGVGRIHGVAASTDRPQ